MLALKGLMRLGTQLQASSAAPVGSAGPALTHKQIQRMLSWPYAAMLTGLFAIIIVCTAYRPLDRSLILIIAMVLVGLPMTWYLVVALRKREAQSVDTLKLLFGCSAILTVAFFGVLLANGAWDRQTPQQMRCTLVRSYDSMGRRSHSYHLLVRSWRPNHNTENLEVGRITYQRARGGSEVLVELHPGFFGIAWYGRVSPT